MIPLKDKLLALSARWESEGKRCYDLAHEKRGQYDAALVAQSVRYWECARELKAVLGGQS